MNCKQCQKEMENRLAEGKVPLLSPQMKTHLEQCSECMSIFQANNWLEKGIEFDKKVSQIPDLTENIMASIANLTTENNSKIISLSSLFSKAASIAVAASVIMALGTGFLLGQQKPKQQPLPEELLYLDDASIESINFLATE